MTVTAVLFLAFASALAVTLLVVAERSLPRHLALIVAMGLPLWLVYVGILSALGVVADPARRPPGITFIVGPVVLFVLVVTRSAAGGRAVGRRRRCRSPF